MRELYVCTKDAWLTSHHACHFHPVHGSHYIDLDGGLILVSVVFNGEHGKESFNAHPDVADLPDPVFEGMVTMSAHRDNQAKKYTDVHHAALASTLGVTDTDTVVEVSKKSEARCKSVRIGHIS